MRLRNSRSYHPPSCTQIKSSINRHSPPAKRGIHFSFYKKSPALRLWHTISVNPVTSGFFSSSPWFFPDLDFQVKKSCVSPLLCCASLLFTHAHFPLSLMVRIDRPIARDGKSPPQWETSLSLEVKS